jgi:hypothetical protein
MRLVDASTDRIPTRGKWHKLVLDFIDSGLSVAEVKDLDCPGVTAYRGIIYVLNTRTYPVKVMKRGERIFLTRTDE